MKLENISNTKLIVKKYITLKDIIFYSAILVFCYFSFEHGDILHTGGSSLTYLDGHILDFYEANLKTFLYNNYLPSTYIVFAIWNIPIKLFHLINAPSMDVGFIVFWYKLLTTLFYAASAIVIYKIGLVVGLTKENSKLLVAFWITTPIAFFSQFIFGQYDIITIYFVLLGLLFYLKKNIKLFILFFAISITFKYFPLFIFVPLLLLIEKRPLKLVLNMIFLMIPIVFEISMYIKSQAFRDGVLGFSTNERVFTAGFKIDYGITISAFVVIWFLICAFAYWKNIKDDQDFISWSLYLPMLVSCTLFSLMLWNPQWVLFITPFLAITTFLHKRAKFFILIDIVMMFFYVGFTVNFFVSNVDQTLWRLGIFGKHINGVLTDPNSIIPMKTFFVPNDNSLYFSFVSACLLINIIFKFPLLKSEHNNELSIKKDWNLVRSRFIIGVMIFIIPATATIFLPSNGQQLYNINSEKLGVPEPIGEITQGVEIGQVFKAESKKIKLIQFQFATYSRINSSHLTFTLREYNPEGNGEVLVSRLVDAKDLKDNQFFEIKLKDFTVSPEKYYSMNIQSSDAIPGNAVTVYHTPAAAPQQLDKVFATINGVKQNYNLHFMIYGEK